jgi:hypothetical protein
VLQVPGAASEPDTESDADSSEDESDGGARDDEDTGLTENQNRLLYMISLYTQKSDNRYVNSNGCCHL